MLLNAHHRLLPASVDCRPPTPLLDVVHNCRAEHLLRGLPDASIDLIVTSPPYNRRNTCHGPMRSTGKWTWKFFGYDGHDDAMPDADYIAWQRSLMQQMMRVLKPSGALFYNHSQRVQNGLMQDHAASILLGFPVRQVIIWDRGKAFNFNDGYFGPCHEQIYLVAKPGFKLQSAMNRLKSVWSIPPDQGNPHPAPMPEKVAEQCVLSGSPVGGVVVDPFGGSGTVAVVAQRTNRHYVTCDISRDYCDMMEARLNEPFTTHMFERKTA